MTDGSRGIFFSGRVQVEPGKSGDARVLPGGQVCARVMEARRGVGLLALVTRMKSDKSHTRAGEIRTRNRLWSCTSTFMMGYVAQLAQVDTKTIGCVAKVKAIPTSEAVAEQRDDKDVSCLGGEGSESTE